MDSCLGKQLLSLSGKFKFRGHKDCLRVEVLMSEYKKTLKEGGFNK